MKYCNDCKVLNENDALVCKICGKKLDEKTKVITKTNKIKPKTKTKHKTKVKSKTKKIVKDNREKGRMNFFQKFMFFILFNLCLALICICGYLGYHIYQNEYIDIPNVTGYTYESAEAILKDKKLNSEKIEVEVSDENEVGIVIKQSKKGKASENTIIKLSVGVLKKEIIMPDVVKLTSQEAINLLNEKKINYKIVYEEGEKEDTVIKQSIKKGIKIKPEETVILTISKKGENKQKIEQTEDNKIEDNEESKEMTNE